MSDSASPSPDGSERRLAAIVFTDVVSYSARMQRDESGTLTLVRADFARMGQLCKEHRGEVLNSMGDGLLLCFPSAVQAVTCALQIQGEFAARRAREPAEKALEHRMGIHIGDVFRQETGGVAGDGVNIAARLEGKAPYGGICISQMVYDTVRGKIPMQAVFAGPETFKNIEPMPVWHIAPENAPPLAKPAGAKGSAKAWPRRAVPAIAVVAVALGAGWWFARDRSPGASSAQTPEQTASAPQPKASPPPAAPVSEKSLAVLPLENHSPDPENAFFTDGMHAEIISTLSRIPDLKVISRASSLALKGSTAPLADQARQLGVANVITGSVRRSGNRVRVLLELRRARDEAVLWASPKADLELKDVWELQTEIAESVARILQARDAKGLVDIARFMTKEPRAFELFMKMHTVFFGHFGDAAALKETIRLGEEALRIDGNFMTAAQMVSNAYTMLHSHESDPAQRATYKGEAKRWAETASRLVPGGAGDMAMVFYLTNIEGDFPRALAMAENGVRALPNDTPMLNFHAAALSGMGRAAEAADVYQRMVAIDPLYPVYWSNLIDQLALLRREPPALAAMTRLESLVKPGDAFRHVLPRARYRLRGELPVRLDETDPAERIEWLWRDRKIDELLAFAERELAAPAPATSTPSAPTRLRLQLRRSDTFALKGDAAHAKEAAQAALEIAESLRKTPGADAVVTGLQVAEALVRLGRNDDALSAARTALTTAAEATRPPVRWSLEVTFATLYAKAGRPRECVDLLAKLLQVPSGLTVPMLRVDPDWDKVRDDPSFKALLTEPKNSAAL